MGVPSAPCPPRDYRRTRETHGLESDKAWWKERRGTIQRAGARRMLRAMVDSNYRLTGYEPGDLASDLIAQEQVIQPHLPVRLPCYDFTLVALLAFVEAPRTGQRAAGTGPRFRARPTSMV